MSIERKYSKAKAAGNHVVWTEREVVPVPFRLNGLLVDGQEFGVFRVTGSDMYCHGMRADFDVPSGDSAIECNVGLYTAGGVLVPNGRLYLNGVTLGGDKVINPPTPMPSGSLWKLRVEIQSPDEVDTYFPQGLTVTYLLRYATGRVLTNLFVTTDPQGGVGFDVIDGGFEVE